MKKYLIVLAAALVALAGCKPKEDPNALKGISFKQAELTVLTGDTVRLALVADPAEAQLPTDLVWSSSDEEVAQVIDKKGNVAIVGSGNANITAKSGELTAVCKIKALSYEEAWTPSDLTYFPSTLSELPVSDTVVKFEYPSGIYECQLFSVTVCGQNSIDFDEDGVGIGYGMLAEARVLFITKTPTGKEQFLGEIWDWVGIDIVDDEALNFTQYGTAAGEIDPEIIGPVEQAYLEAKDAAGPDDDPDFDADAYEAGVYGAHIAYMMADAEGNVRMSYIYSGIITAGHWYAGWDEEGKFAGWDYDLTVQWCYGYDGLAVNPAAESYSTLLIQPFELALSDPYRYQVGQWGQIVNPSPAPRKANGLRKIDMSKTINLGQAKELKPAKYEIMKLNK